MGISCFKKALREAIPKGGEVGLTNGGVIRSRL